MKRDAIISGCGKYRYKLSREWSSIYPELNRIPWIMLNPSTADADVDDATIRRCISFSKQWGYSAMDVYNLFAFRATNPKELTTADNPVGPLNDQYLLEIPDWKNIVCAWGTNGSLLKRDDEIKKLFVGKRLCHLGLTKDGHPKHPCRLPKNLTLQVW